MSTLDKRKKDKIKVRQTNTGCLIATAVPLIIATIVLIVLMVVKMRNGG